MTLDDWRSYLMSFPAATEDAPFGPEVLTYRLVGKIFALLAWTEEPMCLNLKCEPNHALSLRDTYPEFVTAGYHMNKRHWISVYEGEQISADLIQDLVEGSYELVSKSLTKAQKQVLAVYQHIK